MVELARRGRDDPGLDECGLMIVRQNRWRAARFGLEAGLVDPRTGRRSSAREVIKGLVERLRGTAEALGLRRQLGLVRAMADGPGGAERQLAVFERTGDLAAVARHMAGGHAPEPGPTPPAFDVARPRRQSLWRGPRPGSRTPVPPAGRRRVPVA